MSRGISVASELVLAPEFERACETVFRFGFCGEDPHNNVGRVNEDTSIIRVSSGSQVA